MDNKRNTAETYLEKWAYLPQWDQKLKDVKEGCPYIADVRNYLTNLFMFSMFYKTIDGFHELPDVNDDSNHENMPQNWLLKYESPYLKEIEHKDKRKYVVMNTGLFNEEDQELYFLFKEQRRKDRTQPWYLMEICTCQHDILSDYTDELPCKANFLSEIDFVIFDKNKLRGWDNPRTLNLKKNHIINGRIKEIFSKENEEKILDILYKSIRKSCIKTTFNYKFAIPYIYFDTKENSLKRSFLLPLSLKETEGYDLFAAVKIQIRGEREERKISYVISTLLNFEMAKKDAEIVCLTERNWLCQ